MRIASLCMISFFLSGFVEASESPEDLASKVIEMQASQLAALRLFMSTETDSAFEVVKDESSSRDGRTERESSLQLGVRKPNGGFFLNVSSDTSLRLSLCNERYSASLSKRATAFSPNRPSEIRIEKFASASLVLDTFSGPNVKWLDDIIPVSLTQMYFAFGGTSFEAQYNVWLEANQKASLGSAKRIDCRELIFEGWPSCNEPMTYVIDKTGVIYEMHRESGKQKTTCNVEEFVDIKGIKVPKKFSLKLSGTDSNFKADTKGEWRKISLSEIGFDSSQMYTTYYGLPEPDLGELPEKTKGFPWLLILSVAIIVGGGGYYAYCRRFS